MVIISLHVNVFTLFHQFNNPQFKILVNLKVGVGRQERFVVVVVVGGGALALPVSPLAMPMPKHNFVANNNKRSY